MTRDLPVYVNGRFLTRSVTGVERFAGELLRAVDRRLATAETDGTSTRPWSVLVPPGTDSDLRDCNIITAKEVGRSSGHLWEQTGLAHAARGGILINPCNSGPVLAKRQLTVIHDAAVFDQPAGFSVPYRMLHRTLGYALARRSALATVSHFSRARLADVLGIDESCIDVVPNAADHIDRIAADDTILNRHGLTRGAYLLFVGSFAPNKNLPRALAAWDRARGPHDRFVLVGAKGRSFADHGLPPDPPGVVLPGRVSDADLVALYRHARALVFPSLYEGFGIPPLEAMRFGVPALAADIPPVREVCGEAALFHDPRDIAPMEAGMRALLRDDALRERLAASARERRDLFTWDRSAEKLIELVDHLAAAR